MLDMLDQTTTTPDWTAIKAEYEAGDVSVREIARQHHVSDTAIRKRAKSEAWDNGSRTDDPSSQSSSHNGSQQGSRPVQTEVRTEVQTTLAPDPAVKATTIKALEETLAKLKGETNPDDDMWRPGHPDVIRHGIPALAVYGNPYSMIVIRQESRTCDDEDDPFVLVDPRDVPALVARLQRLAHELNCAR